MYGTLFHLPFFVGTSDIAGIRDNGKGAKELQKGFIVAYEGPVPLYNRCEHIIGNDLLGGAPKKTEGVEETSM